MKSCDRVRSFKRLVEMDIMRKDRNNLVRRVMDTNVDGSTNHVEGQRKHRFM